MEEFGNQVEIESQNKEDSEQAMQEGSPFSDKIIEELTEEYNSNWSGTGKLQEGSGLSPLRKGEERVLSLTVDIPQGTQEVLEIRSSDNIEAITQGFCEKHNLDEECKQMLLDNIRQHLFEGQEREPELREDLEEEDGLEREEENTSEKIEPQEEVKAEENGEQHNPKPLEELAGELESWKKEMEMKIREKISMANCPRINQRSKKLVERRGLTQVPVHERLHQKAMMKQKASNNTNKRMTPILDPKKELVERSRKRPNSRQEKKNQDANIFHHHMLYQKGMKLKHDHDKTAAAAQRRKELQDKAASSFRPQINKTSRKMTGRSIEKREDFLLSYGKMVQEKLKEKKLLKDEEEQKNLFQPSISQLAKKKYAQNKEVRAFHNLYTDAVRRNEKKPAGPAKECTFTPSLTTYNAAMFQGVTKPVAKKEEEKKECTFVPQINKNAETLANRKERKKDVTDYLHSVQKEQEEKIRKKQKEQRESSKMLANQKFVQTKSMQLLGKLEREKLGEIFKALDSDKDGLISAYKIDITVLSIQLLDIFTPLFKTMEDQSLTYTQDEFIDATIDYYKKLTVYDKKAVLDFNRRFRSKEEISEPTFTPQFDPLSLRLSIKRRPPGEEIANIFFRELHESEKKLITLKKEKEERELEQCSFHPSIIRTNSVRDIRHQMATTTLSIGYESNRGGDRTFHFTSEHH